MVVTESDGTGNEPQWERVLWRPQPFPDNYVPPTFLAALSKNRKQRLKLSYLKVTERCLLTAANVLPYQYWPLVLGACTICQHLSVIFVFLAVFTRLLDQTLDPRLLVIVSSASFVVGCIVWEFMEYFGSDAAWNTFSEHRTFLFFKVFIVALIQSICGLGARAVKASLLIFLALIALAPILRTLTAPTSADSISALTTALFLVHAALADYSYAAFPVQRERLTSVLSINAAISAAVVLASRLHNDLAVFALMLFSVEAFALFPILRRRIQVRTVPTAVLSSSSTHEYSSMERSRCQLLFSPLLRYR
jgi:phosphatidylinositol glycan class C protein